MLNVTDVFCETCTDEMNIHVNNLKFATLYILLYMYHLHKVNNRGIIYSYEGEMIKCCYRGSDLSKDKGRVSWLGLG